MRLHRGLRTLGIAAAPLVGLVALLAVVGTFLPSRTQFVDATASLPAPAAELVAILDSRDGQRRLWARAAERARANGEGDGAMQIVDLGGPAAGVGTRIGFFPDRDGSGLPGRGSIVESEAPRRVVLDIAFGLVRSLRTLVLEPVDAGHTRVRWSEVLLIPNPLLR